MKACVDIYSPDIIMKSVLHTIHLEVLQNLIFGPFVSFTGGDFCVSGEGWDVRGGSIDGGGLLPQLC